ncbi:hypothetical protein, partial [Clostridioides difficile]|uniref:hypothetical protein n=1 Tax=Clostridioides difficile TaxID=1496 RepID=UPI001A9A2C76
DGYKSQEIYLIENLNLFPCIIKISCLPFPISCSPTFDVHKLFQVKMHNLSFLIRKSSQS